MPYHDRRAGRGAGSGRFSPKKPFGRPKSDRFESRDGDRPFSRSDRSDRRPFERSDRNTDGRERRFSDRSDRNFDRPSGRFPDREKRFDRDRKFDERPGRSFRKRDDGPGFSTGRTFHPRKKSAASGPKDDGLIRLNRYISNSGVCSRRKADELIAAGEISVNGTVVTELGTKVDPAKDEIRHNGERLKREKMVYVLLNKPKDFITTTDDPEDRKTVMHLVAKATKDRIYPVGRLDRNTTGLLLLTNDGNLADKLSHPRNNVGKMYQVELDKSLSQGDLNKLRFGVQLEDGFIKPDDISYVQGGSKRDIGIQIHSGKNRIVRRMFEFLGYEAIKLDRVVYAGLTKKDLPRGHWRYLEEREIAQLKRLDI